LLLYLLLYSGRKLRQIRARGIRAHGKYCVSLQRMGPD